MRFLLKTVTHPPNIHIREHLTVPWDSQVSSHPALLLHTQGSRLHPWQACLSLAQSLGISRSKPAIARDQTPTSYSRHRVSPQAERRHKLFHLKLPGPFVELRHCIFSHFMYLTHNVSLTNVAVQTSA